MVNAMHSLRSLMAVLTTFRQFYTAGHRDGLLFEGRSTSDIPDAFLPEGHEIAFLDQQVRNLLPIRKARTLLVSYQNSRWVSTMLVLAAAEQGLRSGADISARTHLSLARVSDLVSLAEDARWLTDTGRLTYTGRYESGSDSLIGKVEL